MMIPNWKKPFGCDFFYKLIQRFKGEATVCESLQVGNIDLLTLSSLYSP